jgi:hypothetical protein
MDLESGGALPGKNAKEREPFDLTRGHGSKILKCEQQIFTARDLLGKRPLRFEIIYGSGLLL